MILDEDKYYYEYGLSDEQVKERFACHKNNCKVESQTRGIWNIIKSNVFTYFNLVFIILTILLAIVGAWTDLLFLPVIISNTLIGIGQEIHSKIVLDKLSILNDPKTKTLRNGSIHLLSSEDLALDDICIFEAGSQIPADAIVIDGTAKVNEALITGEADEVNKVEGDILLSGSFVVSGVIKARLNNVGKESYVSRLTVEATRVKSDEQSEIIRSMNRLIIVIGILIIPIGISLFSQSFIYNERSLKDSITGMVAAVIGMIPEGLYLLSSVAMAVSTARLASHKILVHDMKCIETLARVDVLCVDKTGTITEPGMQVCEVFGVITNIDDLKADMKEEVNDDIKRIIGDFVDGMSADNATIVALKDFFCEKNGEIPNQVIPFSSEKKVSKACFGNNRYVLGAPESVLGDNYNKYEDMLLEYFNKGYRIIVFSYDEVYKPLAFIILANSIRSGVKKTFEYFVNNNVEIKVISGDNPITVSAIAESVGIKDAMKYVDASTLNTNEDYYEAVEKYTVFGRVSPAQKRNLIRALKAHKKTVAMTGDGVNDILALKEADCSIAIAAGSEVASSVSQLVLLDSDFTRLPSVVMEGRRVVNNVQRTATLFLSKNIFSMLLAVFSMIFMLEYPLEPSQISLISCFTIGIPAFVLALEPNYKPINGKFLKNILLCALPAGITNFLVISGLVIFSKEFYVDMACLSTVCTILVAYTQFVVLCGLMKPIKKGYIIMLICLILGLLFCILFVGELFSITEIKKHCAMLMILFAIATEPVFRYLNLIIKKALD